MIRTLAAAFTLAALGLATPSFAASPATPRAVAEQFYAAFSRLQASQLAPLYASNVRFRDAVFQYTNRAGTINMWTKILGAQPSPRIRYTLKSVSGEVVRGRWIADYVFFGNRVHNEIDSTLIVRNGQIIQHTDAFPFAPWAAQAFGLRGTHFEFLASNAHFQALVVRALRLGVDGLRWPSLCDIVRGSASLKRVFAARCR